MPAAFDLVTFDTPRPDRLARFWGDVLGLVEVEREDGDRWVVMAEPDTGERRLGFQRGACRPGSVHLDLRCDPAELPDELARLRSLGAVEQSPPRLEPYGAIVNLADPDGNPFDLCTYH